MYINNIVVLNIGPIDKFSFKPKFDEQGNPLPIVIIGDNGKGKTALSSYIADSLVEIAKSKGAYHNIVEEQGAFYKIVSTNNIKIGANYSTSIISYKDEKEITYVEKEGIVNIVDFKNDIIGNTNLSQIENKMRQEDFVKEIIGNINKKDVERIFNSNVLCFFPSYRSEKPSWMNENAIKYNEIYQDSQRVNGRLNKEILVEHAEERNSQWVHSVIVDSLIDIEKKDEENGYVIQGNVVNQQFLKKAKINLERILKLILKTESVQLSMNYRNQNNNFKINYNELIMQKGNTKAYHTRQINSLKELSLGQAVLFNMFATIIRHADINNIENSVDLSKIEGIVVIDEIDMHLDSEMQNEVLPKLLRLFPKIQFIITSHSPLFLLGMDKEFVDNYTLLEMPNGNQITTERFAEFEKSYKYLNNTKKHEEELNKVVQEKIEEIKRNSHINPLIITEGQTDWVHLKNAFNKLKEQGKYQELELDFLEFNYDMGETELVKMKDALIKLPQPYKAILIADRDTNKKEIVEFEEDGKFRDWNNNVYTFRIPIPSHRQQTPKISIEHYYTDEEIKMEFNCNGINRRLFMANEFNKDTGDFLGEENFRTNKLKVENDIEIFDGSEKCRVTKFKDNQQINYALSKKDFAENIKKQDNINYETFSLIFDVIEKIVMNT